MRDVSVWGERLDHKILAIMKLRERKRERETLKQERETINVEICLHKGEVDFKCQKAHLFLRHLYTL